MSEETGSTAIPDLGTTAATAKWVLFRRFHYFFMAHCSSGISLVEDAP